MDTSNIIQPQKCGLTPQKITQIDKKSTVATPWSTPGFLVITTSQVSPKLQSAEAPVNDSGKMWKITVLYILIGKSYIYIMYIYIYICIYLLFITGQSSIAMSKCPR